jgi:hypothetical protein
MVVQLRVTRGTSDYDQAMREFERCWNKFAIQQRILCPSERIESLMSLVRATTQDKTASPDDLLYLAGQALDKVTKMVGAILSTSCLGVHADKRRISFEIGWQAKKPKY